MGVSGDLFSSFGTHLWSERRWDPINNIGIKKLLNHKKTTQLHRCPSRYRKSSLCALTAFMPILSSKAFSWMEYKYMPSLYNAPIIL